MTILGGRNKVHWAQAVPRRSDRRDLRRSLRAASRSFYQQQESQLRVTLAGLGARRAAVVAIRPLRAGNEAIEFASGTRLEVDVHHSSTDPQYLARGLARPIAYLVSARPGYRAGWYWRGFASLYGEVMAYVRVDLCESGQGCLRPPRDHWLYRLGLMVAKL
jgi:hypothetical protein